MTAKPRHPLVVHLIPYDGIGGVEVAARSVPEGLHRNFRFLKAYLVRKSDHAAMGSAFTPDYASENEPRAFAAAAYALVRLSPDILVLSLWRSCLVGVMVKLLRPKTRLILFLHMAKSAHVVDRIVTGLTAKMADEIWADSCATAASRLPKVGRKTVRVVSFLTDRLSQTAFGPATPRFVYWGRLHPRKALPRAVALIAELRARGVPAEFDIVGPDGGALADIEKAISEAHLNRHVRLLGPRDRNDLAAIAADKSFFLQTSIEEGMAMAVVEAMQFGLVPVVTGVGEIPNYVTDGVNGILYEGAEQTVAKITCILGREERFLTMRKSGMSFWKQVPAYRDSFLDAVEMAVHSTCRRTGT